LKIFPISLIIGKNYSEASVIQSFIGNNGNSERDFSPKKNIVEMYSHKRKIKAPETKLEVI
jgi:hypothetical protein